MPEIVKMDSKQAISLLTTIIFGTAILFVPALTAVHSEQDAWISAIFATIGGLLIGLIALAIGLRFPSSNLFEVLEIVFGKFLGKLFGCAYLFWLLVIIAGVLREFGSFLVTAFMPETPIIVFILVVTIIAAYTIWSGLEVLARVSQLFTPLILLSLLILFALATPEMKLNRLLPVWDTSLAKMLKGAVPPIAWFGELVAFLIISPTLNRIKELPKVIYTSVLLNGFFFSFTIVGVLALFGPTLTARWLFPTLNGARLIHLANFIERPEAVIMVVWVTGVYVKISFFYYCLVLGTTQILGMKDYRTLILPMGTIVINCSILFFRNILELVHFLGKVWPPFAIIFFEFGLPLLILLIAFIRGKKEGAPA